ncbi:MAG: hypothetical protein M1823_003582 [Watsoniomyces obsoletus]|nr:MAG: hypothetical protein M1823_003582 [Watsoniomyces obsoletus]
MTTRKPKPRQKSAQTVPPPVPEHHTVLNTADMPPPPPSRTTDELNLLVVRRHHPEVESILSIAPFIVMYAFSVISGQWEKMGIEGTMFVCQLTSEKPDVERYGVFVLNKRGLNNFFAELFHGQDVEVSQENVNVRVTNSEGEETVYGIWIFSEPPPSSTANTRAINAQIIQDCAINAETSRELAAEKERVSTQKPTADITVVETTTTTRRISVHELFGPKVSQSTTTTQVATTSSPQFVPAGDTTFFS